MTLAIRRVLQLLTAAALMVAMVAVSAAPAFAVGVIDEGPGVDVKSLLNTIEDTTDDSDFGVESDEPPGAVISGQARSLHDR